jgi:hypothetical protein
MQMRPEIHVENAIPVLVGGFDAASDEYPRVRAEQIDLAELLPHPLDQFVLRGVLPRIGRTSECVY